MEKKEGDQLIVKSTKVSAMASSVTFSDEIPITNTCNFLDDQSSFMDLLGMQDYYHNSSSSNLLDWLPLPSTTTSYPSQMQIRQPLLSPASPTLHEYSSEVLNTPTSPNSSSISSYSNEATAANTDEQQSSTKAGEENGQEQEVEEELGGEVQDQEDKTKKKLKAKKKNQKRQREPRFAFMTKSDIDNLDDGYRWRKYGQKAVKNSPYPRSYYRCTAAGCGVKKRVERSSDDPSVVMTTYEGQHTHPSPATLRSSFGFVPESAAPTAGREIMISSTMNDTSNSLHFGVAQHHRLLEQLHQESLAYNHLYSSHSQTTLQPPMSMGSCTAAGLINTASLSSFLKDNIYSRGFGTSRHDSSGLRDHGLLQDIVPYQMKTEQPKEALVATSPKLQ